MDCSPKYVCPPSETRLRKFYGKKWRVPDTLHFLPIDIPSCIDAGKKDSNKYWNPSHSHDSIFLLAFSKYRASRL